MASDEDINWNNYYKLVVGKPPRDTLLKGLENFDNPNLIKSAIDLGCGAGNDTLKLLEEDWEVLAIDNQQQAITTIKKRILPHHNLKTQVSSFEDLDLPPTSFINAGYSIPFCHPDYFNQLWNNIENSLSKGGIFSGQLFGINDE